MYPRVAQGAVFVGLHWWEFLFFFARHKGYLCMNQSRLFSRCFLLLHNVCETSFEVCGEVYARYMVRTMFEYGVRTSLAIRLVLEFLFLKYPNPVKRV